MPEIHVTEKQCWPENKQISKWTKKKKKKQKQIKALHLIKIAFALLGSRLSLLPEYFTKNCETEASKMVQWVNAFGVKSEDSSLIFWIHMVCASYQAHKDHPYINKI